MNHSIGTTSYLILLTLLISTDLTNVHVCRHTGQHYLRPIFSMAWHPSGHALATGSKDQTVKFWTRKGVGAAILASPEATYESEKILQKSRDATVTQYDNGEDAGIPVVTAAAAAGEVRPLHVRTSTSRCSRVIKFPAESTRMASVLNGKITASSAGSRTEDEEGHGPPRQRARRR